MGKRLVDLQKEQEAADEAAFWQRDEDPRKCLTAECFHRADDHMWGECRLCKCKKFQHIGGPDAHIRTPSEPSKGS